MRSPDRPHAPEPRADRRSWIVLLTALWVGFVVARPSVAAVITVDGACTLSDAILAANTDTATGLCPNGDFGADEIVLDVDVVLFAADTVNSSLLRGNHSGLPDVAGPLTIRAGLGSTIERDPALGCVPDDPDAFRLLNVISGPLTLEKITLRNGCAAPDIGVYSFEAGGGAILAEGGSAVTLDRSHFVGNTAQAGSASHSAHGGAVWIRTDATLTVVDSTFAGNRAIASVGVAAYGGAVDLDGIANGSFERTRFAGNRAIGDDATDGADAYGGALTLRSGNGSNTSIVDCVLDGNVAQAMSSANTDGASAEGGGLYSPDQVDELSGTEITNNRAIGADGESSGGSARGGGASLTSLTTSSRLLVRGNQAQGGSSFGFGGSAIGGGLFFSDGVDSGAAWSVVDNEARGGPGSSGGDAYAGGLRLGSGSHRNHTIVGNRAIGGDGGSSGGAALGGGVFQYAGIGDQGDFLHSTVTGNEALSGDGTVTGEVHGGGFLNSSSPRLSARWQRVPDRARDASASRGARGTDTRVAASGGETLPPIVIANSLFADNTVSGGGAGASAEDCYAEGALQSDGFNLIESPGSGCVFGSTGDQTGIDPVLGPVDDYGCDGLLPEGGCLPTVALDLGSPAIDQGTCSFSGISTDGRGYDRPADLPAADLADGCDIGAYEARPVRYVDDNAMGMDDGTSWTDAFPTLQDALAVTTAGDELWIAAGAYFPDEGGGQSDGDRSASFHIPDGARLLGGFAGSETLVSSRDPDANRTVLSGDVDGNDTVDGDQVTISTTNLVGSNSYHVVSMASPTGALVLDGLVLSGGLANGSSPDDAGAAIRCDPAGTPTLRDLHVIGNKGSARGALAGCTPTASDSLFESNVADDAGGVSESGGTFRRTTFRANSAGTQASLFYIGGDLLELVDVVVEGNVSGSGAGAVRSLGELRFDSVLLRGNRSPLGAAVLLNSSASSFLRNVTVTGNDAGTGGAIRFAGFGSLTIENSILWNNRVGGTTGTLGASLTDAGVGTLVVRSSLLQGSGGSDAWAGGSIVDGGSNLDMDPQLVVPTDPTTAPTTAGDSHILATSPAFDAGDDGAVTTSTDLDGAARIQNLAVDLGAYETPFTRIGDRVWLDENDSGLQDEGEGGVAGVSVELLQSGDAVDSTVTAEDGTYAFDWVAPGEYTLRFTPPPGYAITYSLVGGDPTIDSNPQTDGETDPFVFGYAIDLDFDAGLLCKDEVIADGTLSTDVIACGTVTLGGNLVIDGDLSIEAGEKIVIENGVQFTAGSSISLGVIPF